MHLMYIDILFEICLVQFMSAIYCRPWYRNPSSLNRIWNHDVVFGCKISTHLKQHGEWMNVWVINSKYTSCTFQERVSTSGTLWHTSFHP